MRNPIPAQVRLSFGTLAAVPGPPAIVAAEYAIPVTAAVAPFEDVDYHPQAEAHRSEGEVQT